MHLTVTRHDAVAVSEHDTETPSSVLGCFVAFGALRTELSRSHVVVPLTWKYATCASRPQRFSIMEQLVGVYTQISFYTLCCFGKRSDIRRRLQSSALFLLLSFLFFSSPPKQLRCIFPTSIQTKPKQRFNRSVMSQPEVTPAL